MTKVPGERSDEKKETAAVLASIIAHCEAHFSRCDRGSCAVAFDYRVSES
jgi:hypothetical protein